MQLNELKNITDGFLSTAKMPVLFIGHGHPMNAIFDNSFTQSLAALGTGLTKPAAVLVISAHWETVGTYVSTNPWPKAIYDFGPFDNRLFNIQYAPKGHPVLADELIKTVTLTNVEADDVMGLDHGAWTVLKHIFPAADVPVFEMSIDYAKPPSFHYQLGQQLKSLRNKGVMILCSGNIVHNLYLVNWHNIDAPAFDWNIEFDTVVKQAIEQRNYETLVNYHQLGAAAKLAIPTNEHYLPMLYALGLLDKNEPVTHIYEGYQYAGISMRCFKAG
jgi:4,5-DOPA dioxygenase extradiol